MAGDGCRSPARPCARRCPLPAPFHRGVGILSGQGIGKFYPATAGGQIGLMNVSHFPEVLFELVPEPVGQQRASVLAALAIAHDQLPPSEVEVLNPQPQSFHQSQPTPIQQPRHQRLSSCQTLQHHPHLLRGQHHRQPPPSSCPYQSLQLQIAQKSIHLGAAHLPGMTHEVKTQEPPEPLLIGLHRTTCVVTGLQFLSVALDKPGVSPPGPALSRS